MSERVLVVANVLLTPRREVLLGLRADVRQWEEPGGKVEDETVLEAWHRELREETGMTTEETPQLVGHSDTWFGGRRATVLYLMVRSWSGFPQRLEPTKCLAWQWFPLDGLPKVCTPGTREALRGLPL